MNNTQFKPGQPPWNKGIKGRMKPNSGSFKKGLVPWNKKEKIEKSCLFCGKTFYVIPAREVAKYCSMSCSGKVKGSPMAGRKHSEEAKKKMSAAKFGRIGELCPNWRGGLRGKDRLERTRFRDRMQKIVFERDDYTCQMCGKRGGDLQVDHIQPWAEYVELRFNINNCRTLCMSCHYQVTFNKPMPSELITWGHNFNKVAVREAI
jgi:hypothetical protein